ncbi:MAG TPA: hypothetical protein VMW01_07835 [Williamwhitmania sp.]|nr:hypothetical protein [Williamwhitmania sp.]
MKRILLTLLIAAVSCGVGYSQSINTAYSNITSNAEKGINPKEWLSVIAELNSLPKDTIGQLTSQAIVVAKYLTSHGESHNQKVAGINVLLDFSIGNPSLFGNQTIPFLKTIPRDVYDSSAIKKLELYLSNGNNPSLQEAIKVSGYVGGEELHSFLLQNESLFTRFKRNKWPYALAMSRLGDTLWLNYCLEKVKKLEVNTQTIYFVFPDLAYTRQQAAIQYLVDVLQNMSYSCDSPNPESTSKIDCGYRVMELLAPAVADFPFSIGVSGDLKVDNYKKALIEVREWFSQKNGSYQIRNDNY